MNKNFKKVKIGGDIVSVYNQKIVKIKPMFSKLNMFNKCNRQFDKNIQSSRKFLKVSNVSYRSVWGNSKEGFMSYISRLMKRRYK